MFELRGLATGIGSLPHKNAAEALDLIFKYCPQLPFWPQLPKRGMREGMVAQFIEGLPCIKLKEDGVVFDPAKREEELAAFYEKIINKDVEHFRISQEFAEGLYAFRKRLEKADLSIVKALKCHITGPFTFAASFKDNEGRSLLHDPEMMQAFTEGLSMKAAWQMKFLGESGKKPIVFIDEPYLGCFGSAYTPLNREEAVSTLKLLTERIKASAGALTGAHCCGNTDWSIFTDVPTLDIINFDAFNYLDKFTLYPKALDKFLKRGGIICWGIVPTSQDGFRDSPEGLTERLKNGIGLLAGKGADKDLLSERLLLSPSCGVGTLAIPGCEKIFSTLADVSKKMGG